MLFNSYIFIFLFFPLALIGYYTLNYFKQNKLAMIFLVGMSFWFYAYNNIYYLFMLIGSILLNFLLVEGMDKIKNRHGRRICFLGGVLLNLGILFFFKYYDFFVENMNVALKTEMPFLRLALPIGISFYTFQQLSYIVDFYKNECEKYSLVEYALYVSFFPQLIAGPIVYHTEIIPQFRDSKNWKINYVNLSKGIYAFACGLAKKVLIADIFSRVVVVGFGNISELSTLSAILVMICYSLQIYYDFSGYCDMAYGIGFFFNIQLPINFNSPYKADSISDFWNRWHMTLNRFFIKYVYIPLGGNRKGKFRTYFNQIFVFFVSGLWHGANWTYIFWGGANGIAVALNRAGKKWIDKVPRTIRTAVTYVFFLFTLVIFRSNSMHQAGEFFYQLFCVRGDVRDIYAPLLDSFNSMIEVSALQKIGFAPLIDRLPWFFLVLYMLIVLVASFTLKNTQEKVAKMKFSKKEIVVIASMMIWSIMSLSEVSEFLYYNF